MERSTGFVLGGGSMSIEQTDQLIRLILNSVLLVIACVVVTGGLMIRHTAITNRLHATQRDYHQLLMASSMANRDRLHQLSLQIRQLRQHYRATHYSVVAAHYALLFCVGSTLVMACRALINLNQLINIALILFVVGIGVLLISVGLTLLDFYAAHRALWDDVIALLTGRAFPPLPNSGVSPRRSLPPNPQSNHLNASRSQRISPKRVV
jgi:hypothetical protein